MKTRWLWTLPSIILSLASFILAWKGIDGWGWFLFAAIILYPNKKTIKEED